MNNEEKVQVIPIGGVEEIGVNCTAFRYKDQIIIVDVGMGFSDIDHLGIDYLIPNYEWLKENVSKIEGIFITHGHLDHIGAIEHFVRELDFPDIFAPEFAMELIMKRLEEAGLLEKARPKLHVVSDKSNLKGGDLHVEYFRVNHSIPDSFGLIINTPVGRIVHSGDFKFDNSPLNEPKADYLKMAKAGEAGVRLLLSDSTNSYREGHSISELEIMKRLREVISNSKGRVIVATFASLVTRLYALVEIAKEDNRKIFISGRSMHQSIEIATRLKYINADKNLFIDAKSLHRFSDRKVMVLATGSQGENMSALSRMARGEHREVTIRKGDTVIFSSSVIPGNDLMVQNLIDEISRLGAKIYHKDIMNLHTSGHGFIEDQKLMINLFNPELFMPVHGVQYFLNKHAETARELGVPEKNCIVPKRGEIIEITKNGWSKQGKIKSHLLLVSGLGVGDVGPLVLQAREQLAANGVVVISMVLRSQDKSGHWELAKQPTIISRGFVFVKQNSELMQKIQEKVESIFSQMRTVKGTEIRGKLKLEIERNVGSMLYSLTQREPLIINNIELLNDKPATTTTTIPAD